MDDLSANPPQPASFRSIHWVRGISLSLGVLCTGLTISYVGFFLGQKYPKPVVSPTVSVTSSPTPTPTASPTALLQYTNTALNYSLSYASDLNVIGEGLQVTEHTAPDVTFTTSSTAASPDSSRVFHISGKEKSLLTSEGKPISSYTTQQLITMDFQATVNNKNIYVATLAPITPIRPLPKNILDGYSFSVQAKGYQTIVDGVLWNVGNYVINELDTATYHYIIVYSATNEMKKMFATIQFGK